jgi:glycosidase
MTIAGGDVDSVKLSTLLLLTFPGAPSIYYGDEVGLAGGIDPDSRRSFPQEANWNLDLLKCHQELVTLRHRYPALRTGSYQVLLTEGMVYAFVRSLPNESVMVAVNAGTTPAEVSLAIGETNLSPDQLQVLYGNAEIDRSEQGISLRLPARSGCVLGD